MIPDPTGEIYLWLSAAFDLPAAALLTPAFAELGSGCVRALETASPSGGAVAGTPLTDCRKAFDRLRQESADDATGEQRLTALRREYARLFIGPPRALARPYESCYFTRDALMTERTQAVRAFYESAGVAFDAHACLEPPDHIVVELHFLAMLLGGKTGHPPAERRSLAKRFLEAHPGQWARTFAACVLAETRTPLYRSAAMLLDAVIAASSPDRLTPPAREPCQS